MFGRDKNANANASRRQDPRSQFLRSLYYRAAAARGSPQTQSSSLTSSTSSIADSSSRSTTYAMLGNLRRVEPQPTVELARPAPEVEFSRVADVVRPVLRNYVPSTGSASLLSLRANQQGPGFADSPLSSASLAERSSIDGGAAGSLNEMANGESDRSDEAGHPGADSTPAFAYFSDERDIPFRSNAVEIAAQDDKRECAFLSHEYHNTNSELERARLILPLLVGQPRPTTEFGGGMPASRGAQKRPSSPRRLLDELDVIDEFNRQAQERVAAVDPRRVLAQFPLQHLQAIIRQLLDEIEVPEASGWDLVIRDLVLNALSRVRPDVQGGERMDLRHYVRIKRIPGGEPSDSQYISGIVFTKNLAHRLMPRFQKAPQIMLLTLPLEYSAQIPSPASRYVSFDEELRMQQGFTEKLVQRIAGAAPSLVLADKPVPRQVLEGLMRHRIAVAHGIKRSVIRAIARCTGAEIVTSMNKFSDYPRTGTCASLAVQTYEHPSLPEYRKSFFFLDGCIEQRGGTIVLRGDSFERLADIKQVVDLVICLSHSMMLETSLLIDEYALAVPGKYELSPAHLETQQSEDALLAQQALSEYNIVLSSSPCVRIPPPHVLVCMREKELAIRAISEKFDKMSAGRKGAPLGDSSGGPGAGTGVSFLVSRQQSAASSNRLQQQYESELALHESYIHEGKIFLRDNPHMVSLWDYQSIAITYMLACSKHDFMLCAGPQHYVIPFYTGSDATLGEYLEMCFVLSATCSTRSRRCAHPMYEHRHSYLHNNGRVDVTMDEYPCPIERLSEVILMWSECTRCQKRTPVVRMSGEAWCYSFGKYLELTFYNARLRPRTSICEHDLHKDFVRCFTLRNMVVRFSYSEFPIWGIATPTMPLYFNMEVSIRLKEEEAADLRKKMGSYYASLLSRLEAFPLEVVDIDKADECRHALHSLSARAATEQVYFQQTLEQTLRNTHPADTLVLVVVYEALQGKVLEWNLQFSELVQSFIQLDRSSRSTAPNTAKRAAPTTGAAAGENASRAIVGHEIDSLEIIDELHSAADHHYNPGDAAAHDSARFEMPHLAPSPSNSTSDLTLVVNQQEMTAAEPEKMPRLHRRLSMEMMRQERERQERLQEKHRRTADSEERTRLAKGALKGKAHAHQRQQAQHPTAIERSNSAEQKHGGPAVKHPGKAALPNGYSTARLIGHIATDVDDDMRIPRQTEFPELRGRKGKAKKFASILNRGAQPLLDILHRPTSVGSENSAKKDAAPPSRIPVIRAQASGSNSTETRLPPNRQIPSRPPNARQSYIPRPPNIRSRAASPTEDIEHGRGASNVFLRLAKRLNNRNQPNVPAALGTVPRKMDLLLPAAAQYISQHPKRPSTPQVQVFYTKPASEEATSRKGTPPPRRHSYQIPAEASGANSGSVSSQGAGTHAGRNRAAYHRLPSAMSDNDDAEPDAEQDAGSYGYRYRSATVSQVQMQQSASDSTQSQPPAPSHPSILPRKSRETLLAGLSLEQNEANDSDTKSNKERKHSISLRPSNIIPTITRRLGLGFGFKSSASKNSGTSAATTDDEGMTSGRHARSRVSSSGTKNSMHERGPIPPRLVIDSKTRGAIPVASRSQSRNGTVNSRVAGKRVDPFMQNEGSSSDSSMGVISIDTDTSSECECDLDTYNVEITRGVLQTPVGTISGSYRDSSYLLDSHNSEPGSADSSSAQIDLIMGSPLRSLHPSMRLSQHMPSSVTDSEDGAVRNMLGSLRRRNQHRLGHESSADDDDIDARGPDLHFGQSDAGSDADHLGSVNDQDAKDAEAYLRSVIAASTGVSNAQASEFSNETSAASASAATMHGLPLTKSSSMESALGVGAPVSGEAATALPQENITKLWKAISNLLIAPGTSQLFQLGLDLVYPLGPTEHLIAGSPIIVREEEPSSIIAYTLLDSEFRKSVQVMFEEARTGRDTIRHANDTDGRSVRSLSGSLNEEGGSPSPINEFSQMPPPRSDDEVIERIMLHSLGHHVSFKLTAGQTKFSCQVFYAAQFEALRRCNGCEDSYIESLSRCNPYVAKGGKSGSAFLRTRDERFIIKQISTAEADAFLKFAPFYFEHMFWNWTFREERPTVLAKIFGFCRVSYHNKATGKKLKDMNVVIMENLFYGR
ncbi:Mitochondrial distribution and morphology protein 12, partial [Coemansia erecta]